MILSLRIAEIYGWCFIRTDIRTDRPSYRDALPHLKMRCTVGEESDAIVLPERVITPNRHVLVVEIEKRLTGAAAYMRRSIHVLADVRPISADAAVAAEDDDDDTRFWACPYFRRECWAKRRERAQRLSDRFRLARNS